MPKVTHIIVMTGPLGSGKLPELKSKPDRVSILTMEEVEAEGAKPSNSKYSQYVYL